LPLTNTADILGPVLGGEPKVLVDPHAYIVAIEAVGEHATLVQHALELYGDGALAAARQAGKPDRCALVTEKLTAVFAGDIALVPVHVCGALFSHAGPSLHIGNLPEILS
jgi:hypothetical protein